MLREIFVLLVLHCVKQEKKIKLVFEVLLKDLKKILNK